jgi:hypothetical protein
MSQQPPCANDAQHSPAVFILEDRRVVCSACAATHYRVLAGGRQPVDVAGAGEGGMR